MTIFQKILRMLTPADAKRSQAKAERAEQTEKAIERYGSMLNATASATAPKRRGGSPSLKR